MQDIVILGAGGGSRDLLDIFEAANTQSEVYHVLGFVVDPQYAASGTEVNGKPVLGGYDWLERHAAEVQVICGVGAPEVRSKMVNRALDVGVRFCTIFHPSAIFTPRMTIGEGSSIGAGCILTNGISIGKHVYINIGCTISHDVILADCVTLSPGVHIAGYVTVGVGAFIGLGANIVGPRRIGEWSIIGAGSTIIEDVPANTTVVGVPGKVIKTRHEGWQTS